VAVPTSNRWIFYSAVNSIVPQIILNLGFESNSWDIAVRQISYQIPTIICSLAVTWWATRFKDLSKFQSPHHYLLTIPQDPLLSSLTVYSSSPQSASPASGQAGRPLKSPSLYSQASAAPALSPYSSLAYSSPRRTHFSLPPLALPSLLVL